MVKNRRPDDGSPLYRHVKQELLAAIARGEYVADQPFITQREVCERFDVSTTTAVRALNELVAEGELVRRRGLGTFVAPKPAPATRRAAVDPGRARTVAYVGPQ